MTPTAMTTLGKAQQSLKAPLGSGLGSKPNEYGSRPLSWDERRSRAEDRVSQLKSAVQNGEITKDQARAELGKIGLAPTINNAPWLF